MLTLILGGARSGKSWRAQKLAEACEGDLFYIATAQAFDEEMADRIAHHRRNRGARWQTVEAPIDLPGAIASLAAEGRVLLIDCLTLWATNLMLNDRATSHATDALLASLAAAPCPVIIVSNEVGMGIVPDNALARRFRDVAGRLNQQVAAAADTVELIVAGLHIKLK